MNRAEKAALQLEAVGVLRTLKRSRTYEELADETGLPAGDLNRYVNGHVLPGADRAGEIVESIGQDLVASELERRVDVDADGYVDTTRAVFDPGFLRMVAPVVATTHEYPEPDVVLTAATDGITLATAFADHFDATCAYAKKARETAVEEFYEARERTASGIELTYYLPRNALSETDTVLVVDDLIRSGETQELLLDIAQAAGATVGGVFALIAAGDDGMSRAADRVDAPVHALSTVA